MTGKVLTLKDVTQSFFANTNPYFPPPNENDRLWVHDSLHASLGIVGSSKSEETVAIYQAVLLRSPDVTQRPGPLKDGGRNISLDDIHQKVLPGVKGFVNRLSRQFNFRIHTHLSDAEVEDAYTHARALYLLLSHRLGRPLGRTSVVKYMSMPADEIINIVEASKQLRPADTLLVNRNDSTLG